MAQIALDRAEKVYKGGVHAVRGLTLRIEDGRMVALVGPSGCGKSTTLRMIAGLEHVTSGTISIGSRVVNAVAPGDRDIAMVFQNHALYPHMSVHQNLAFGLRTRKTPRAEIDRRVREASALLGLEAYLGRRPHALSGGQRQRVAVGRAIVREPACFLFDEPLSNLDTRLRVAMRSELKALHQRLKTTTIHVTHDQEEAMSLGELVVVMADGRVQQAGPPEEVFHRPANRFVAGFMGSPPMNFLDGTLHRRDETLVWREDARDPAEVALSGPLVEPAGPHAGRPVVIGVRPGALTVRPDACAQLSFVGVVIGVEPLGEQTDLRLTTRSGATLTARVPWAPGATPRRGETIRLAIDPGGVHAFEPGPFGRALNAPATTPATTTDTTVNGTEAA